MLVEAKAGAGVVAGSSETAHGDTHTFLYRGGMMEDLPSLDELERRYVMRVLAHTKGNISKAAKILGVDRKTLYRMREALSQLAPTVDSWDVH